MLFVASFMSLTCEFYDGPKKNVSEIALKILATHEKVLSAMEKNHFSRSVLNMI